MDARWSELSSRAPFCADSLLVSGSPRRCRRRLVYPEDALGGAERGSGGVSLAWLLYILVQGRWTLLEQVGGIVIGGTGKGLVIAVIVVILGGILGALGGYIGSGIRLLVSSEISGKER